MSSWLAKEVFIREKKVFINSIEIPSSFFVIVFCNLGIKIHKLRYIMVRLHKLAFLISFFVFLYLNFHLILRFHFTASIVTQIFILEISKMISYCFGFCHRNFLATSLNLKLRIKLRFANCLVLERNIILIARFSKFS